MKEAMTSVEIVAAMEEAKLALDTWLCTYAQELVGDTAYLDACERLGNTGVLSFISSATDGLDRAMTSIRDHGRAA